MTSVRKRWLNLHWSHKIQVAAGEEPYGKWPKQVTILPMGKWLVIFWITLWTSGCSSGAPFDHSHTHYAKVLQQINKGGLVDYAALKTSPQELNAYLDQVSAVSKSDFEKWNKAEQIAFLVNLYNASVLKTVAENYPIADIRKFGNGKKGAGEVQTTRLFKKKIPLDSISLMLRSDYPEPRIHFALVPASLGGPALRTEPYTADKLDSQLADQARRFMSSPAKNRIDLQQHVIYLSSIFKWYPADFEKGSGSLLRYVAQFYPPPVQEELRKTAFDIRYTEYNWALNDAKAFQSK
ncbi:MAG: hypothetical protein JWM16_3502 [Verrucomicrobiales bacterium]|nr:hypothetical protein [Verrucomicrobiales bacterium]